jgi:hypothetical protein
VKKADREARRAKKKKKKEDDKTKEKEEKATRKKEENKNGVGLSIITFDSSSSSFEWTSTPVSSTTPNSSDFD